MSRDGKKLYVTICAEFAGDGKIEEWSGAELLLGKKNIERGGAIYCELCKRLLSQYTKIKQAKAGAGADTSEEDGIIEYLTSN